MSNKTIPLGRVRNIPIYLDYSWFLIFILLTWSLAASYFPHEFPNWPVAEYWALGAITAIFLFISVLLHELGHSFVARHYRIPVRSITLFLFGGVAQIASEPPSASAEFWIAIAGPLVSFALGGLFAFAQPFTVGFAPLFGLVKYTAYINLVLALFNLIPGFPLDGGRVFRAIVWGVTHNQHKATRIAGTTGQFIAFLFIAGGVWMLFTGNFGSGLWIAFIGWFLASAAKSQLQAQAVQEMLEGHTVSQAMSLNFSVVPANLTLQELANDPILGEGKRYLTVEEGGKVLGVIPPKKIQKVPHDRWTTTTAGMALDAVHESLSIQPDTQLWDALEEMEMDGVSAEPVIADGEIEGVLSQEEISRYLRSLQKVD